MAYNHEFPYTDPYRYNSDWILKTIDELNDKYDEMFSLYQEIQEEFENLPETVQAIIDSALAEYVRETDEKILALRNFIDRTADELTAFVNSEVNTMNNRLEFVENESIARDNILQQNIDSNYRLLLQNIIEVNVDLQSQIDDLRELIEHINGYSRNPLTGEVEETTDVIDCIFEYLRIPNALSNTEIELQYVTYGDVADAYITYGEFATNSRRILKKLYNNPLTGSKDNLNQIHAALAQSMLALTNNLIDANEITYGDIDEANITYGNWITNQNYLDVEGIKDLSEWTNGSRLKLLEIESVVTPTVATFNINDLPSFDDVLAITFSYLDSDDVLHESANVGLIENGTYSVELPDNVLNTEIKIYFKMLYAKTN